MYCILLHLKVIDFVNDDAHVKDRRFKFPNDQFYFKSTEEMQALFSDVPEAEVREILKEMGA